VPPLSLSRGGMSSGECGAWVPYQRKNGWPEAWASSTNLVALSPNTFSHG
jgi:hypothetical protein